jgi:hypothetical protein
MGEIPFPKVLHGYMMKIKLPKENVLVSYYTIIVVIGN